METICLSIYPPLKLIKTVFLCVYQQIAAKTYLDSNERPIAEKLIVLNSFLNVYVAPIGSKSLETFVLIVITAKIEFFEEYFWIFCVRLFFF